MPSGWPWRQPRVATAKAETDSPAAAPRARARARPSPYPPTTVTLLANACWRRCAAGGRCSFSFVGTNPIRRVGAFWRGSPGRRGRRAVRTWGPFFRIRWFGGGVGLKWRVALVCWRQHGMPGHVLPGHVLPYLYGLSVPKVKGSLLFTANRGYI